MTKYVKVEDVVRTIEDYRALYGTAAGDLDRADAQLAVDITTTHLIDRIVEDLDKYKGV